MSYLYDGSDKNKLEIPPIEIFQHNYYKKYKIPEISTAKLGKMTLLNSFTLKDQEAKAYKTLVFCFKALINHDRKNNVKVEYISSNYAFIFASEDI